MLQIFSELISETELWVGGMGFFPLNNEEGHLAYWWVDFLTIYQQKKLANLQRLERYCQFIGVSALGCELYTIPFPLQKNLLIESSQYQRCYFFLRMSPRFLICIILTIFLDNILQRRLCWVQSYVMQSVRSWTLDIAQISPTLHQICASFFNLR